jgi:hypothetical protein
VPLYPLGISRRRDIQDVPKQASETVHVRWSLAGELACAFIDAPHRAVPPRLHAAVLDAIHRRICVLPVRFGVALHAETEIHALLQERSRELLDDLSRLDCTCEMGVQIAPPVASPENMLAGEADLRVVPAPKGMQTDSRPAGLNSRQSPLAYIEQRRAFYNRADDIVRQGLAIVQRFVESMHNCYREWRRLPPSPSRPVRLAFLIERDRARVFQNRVQDSRKVCGQWRCAVLGPWPPYSFIETVSERLHADVGGPQRVESVQSAQE